MEGVTNMSTPHKSEKIMKFWFPVYWQWVPHSTCFDNDSHLTTYWSDVSYYLSTVHELEIETQRVTISWHEVILERSVLPKSERKWVNQSMKFIEEKTWTRSKKWGTWKVSHLTHESDISSLQSFVILFKVTSWNLRYIQNSKLRRKHSLKTNIDDMWIIYTPHSPWLGGNLKVD